MVCVKVVVFWAVTACSSVGKYQCFRISCLFLLQNGRLDYGLYGGSTYI